MRTALRQQQRYISAANRAEISRQLSTIIPKNPPTNPDKPINTLLSELSEAKIAKRAAIISKNHILIFSIIIILC